MAEMDSVDLARYDYHLPVERIAQHPTGQRDESRLLCLKAGDEAISHCRFGEIEEYLRPGDVLVLNDTRVVPARLAGRKKSGGKVEVLLLGVPSGRPDGEAVECLIKGGGLRVGLELFFKLGLHGLVVAVLDYGRCQVEFQGPGLDWVDLLRRIGRVPLPPYIKRETPPGADSVEAKRYQTVYAAHDGAVAAPTAGLHFTPELLGSLERMGVEQVRMTLHVGYGTFEPLRARHLARGRLHPETYTVTAEAAERVKRAGREGRRVVAVGTSTVRLLEHLALNGGLSPAKGRTELFIGPGFPFQVVGAMVTNFHLPKSSLLMLVSAFAGRKRVLGAYQEAIRREYRFYSFGDAMFIER